ncbi:MAG TPA: outer membrane lipoprotein chaperone LolA [Bryobacteraceae bacterium]
MRRRGWTCASLGLLMAIPTLAAAPATDLQKLLRQIESRYNRAVTLQLAFSEIYTGQGRPHTPERGELFLRKPGRMRWQYTKPAGKLFVSDGKDVYYYNADMNRVERMKVKDAEDMRAPLAFLIGRLDFNRDFRQYQTSPQGDKIWVTCIPKSEKLPFTEVRFLTSAASARIEHVRVVGQDKSVIDFDFSDEVINPPLADSMFQFQIPAGAQYIDSSKGDH